MFQCIIRAKACSILRNREEGNGVKPQQLTLLKNTPFRLQNQYSMFDPIAFTSVQQGRHGHRVATACDEIAATRSQTRMTAGRNSDPNSPKTMTSTRLTNSTKTVVAYNPSAAILRQNPMPVRRTAEIPTNTKRRKLYAELRDIINRAAENPLRFHHTTGTANLVNSPSSVTTEKPRTVVCEMIRRSNGSAWWGASWPSPKCREVQSGATTTRSVRIAPE